MWVFSCMGGRPPDPLDVLDIFMVSFHVLRSSLLFTATWTSLGDGERGGWALTHRVGSHQLC